MTARAYNFSPGPAMLPTEVMERAQAEFLDWQGSGCSVAESTHRGKPFNKLMADMIARVREMMDLPQGYEVLFVQGGATMQFALLPHNLLDGGEADYLISGAWSQKAYDEACHMVGNNRIRDVAGAPSLSALQPRESWDLAEDAAYFHFVYNETISGVMFEDTPRDLAAPLVCDMSSCILSLPVDASLYDVIYAGAQKNLGPAGIAMVILSPRMVERCKGKGILSYATYVKEGSMQNTAPTLTLYLVSLVLEWLEKRGGVQEQHQRNQRKIALLYDFLDQSQFFSNGVEPRYRSLCNVPFLLADESQEEAFLQQAEAAGLVNLRGHRSVGGMRASVYNSMPQEGVEALVEFMDAFERQRA